MELAVNYDIKQITFHHILDGKTLCGRIINFEREKTNHHQGWYIQEGSIEEVSCKICKDIYEKSNSIPMQAVVIKMLAELWHTIEEKRNLVIENLHLDDDGNELPSSEIPEGEELPEGFLGKIYRNQLVTLANEYTAIMDSVNDILVVAGSKHSL